MLVRCKMYRRRLGLGYYSNFFLGCTVLYIHMTTHVHTYPILYRLMFYLMYIHRHGLILHTYTCGKMCTIWTLIFAGFLFHKFAILRFCVFKFVVTGYSGVEVRAGEIFGDIRSESVYHNRIRQLQKCKSCWTYWILRRCHRTWRSWLSGSL